MRHNQPADSNGVATDPPTNDNRSIVELCDAYLATLHVGSWGRAFHVTSDEGRRDAATWLALQIEGVMEHAKSRRG